MKPRNLPYTCIDNTRPLPMDSKPLTFWQVMARTSVYLLVLACSCFLLTAHGRALLNACWGTP